MYKAKILESLQETPRIKIIRLTWDNFSFNFKPGQWVSLWCDDFKDEGGKPIKRAYSIASIPGDKYLELSISRGKCFSAHIQDLPIGSPVNVDGPFGVFSLKPAEKYMFIAGGSGISPFRSMIQQALDAGKKVVLLFSIQTPSDFIYRKDFEKLAKNKNFKLVPTITCDNKFPAWEGECGYVQNVLPKYWKKGFEVYLCGPQPMIQAATDCLLKLGQPQEKIFVDKWS